MSDLRAIEQRTPSQETMGRIVSLFAGGRKLKRGEASAMLHISERAFRANVAKLNELGYPIISIGNGFYLAQTPEDFEPAIARLMAEAVNIHKRIESLRSMQEKKRTSIQNREQLNLQF